MHKLHTGIFFSVFFVFVFVFVLFCFLVLLPGANYPTPSYCRVHMSKQFVLMSQTNKQTSNHDVILINTYCLQICTWQRHSSVTTVNRALLPIWINVIISVSKDCKCSGKYTGLPIRTSLVQIWLGAFIYRFLLTQFFFFFFFFIYYVI